MRSTLKFAIVVAILASTVLLYRRLSTTESVADVTDTTDIDTKTADATGD